MTFYRHFVERKDFDIFVITPRHALDGYIPEYPYLEIDTNRIISRLSRTRLLPWVYGWQCLYGDLFLEISVIKIAKDFKPSAIFTVAGSWHWTALAAQRVAHKLQVPLIASFNDWFSYGWFPTHPALYGLVEARFRRFYREADLALCTSDGMYEALGSHPNAHVLYPTGAVMPTDTQSNLERNDRVGMPFTVFFGGSLADWYGPMIEAVVRDSLTRYPGTRFKIFGSRPTWSEDFDSFVKITGIYRGHVVFEELRNEALNSDLLLLPMGFNPDVAQVESTSFKTKFLDYLSFMKPILVWGPEYCSAVRVAREYGSAECVTGPSPSACSDAIQRLVENHDARERIVLNAVRMYNQKFSPDLIHSGLVNKILKTVADRSHH